MSDYRVIWKIDIEAKNPTEAAKKALEIMLDPTSIATFFDVVDSRAIKSFEVDLLKGTEKEVYDPRNERRESPTS